MINETFIQLVKETREHESVCPFKTSENIGPGVKKDTIVVKLLTDFSLN
jgi:hypothetical protein